jgi:hypothetical protein
MTPRGSPKEKPMPAHAVPGLVIGLLLALSTPARAAEAIATDRPDFVESSDVVDPGRFQIETSIGGERSRIGAQTLHALATPTLLRLGIVENWELRLETDGFTRESLAGRTERGFADTSVSAKWHWQDGDADSGRPALAGLLNFDLASGSAVFRGRGTRPSLRVTAEWELPNGYGVGVMPGLYRDHNEAGHGFYGGVLAVSVSKRIGALHGFVELAGQQLAADKNGGKLVSLDTGLSYLLSDSVQIDAAIFYGLTKRSPDLQWTTGISVRF